jgi:hypothetical protein
MSRVDRIQEQKARTLAQLTGNDNQDTSGPRPGQFSASSGDVDSSDDIRVISNQSGNGRTDVTKGATSSLGELGSERPGQLVDKEQRAKEFRSRKSSSVQSGASATIDPKVALSGPNAGAPTAKQSMSETLGNANTPSDNVEGKASGSNSLVGNQLEQFASYNCIFTLGVLSPSSVNDPQNNYRKNGPTYTILRSGGGGITENRITTGFEQNGNLEYFIDDFTLSSIVAPNQQTGLSLGTRLAFKIYEPYSLGIFLQNLEIAAVKAGYQNYLKAPFLLEIGFLGFDDNGNASPVEYSSRKIPFMLTNIEFNVDTGGSVYEVEGIPWNEQSLTDQVQTTKDPVEIRGASVAETLSFGEQSLTAIINQKQQELAEKDELPLSDLYVIRLPKSRVKAGTVNSSPTDDQSATVSRENSGNSTVIKTSQFKNRITDYFGDAGQEANNNIYQTLVGETTTDVNAIGSSQMVEDYNQGSNHPFPRGLYTYDEEAQVYRRDGIELSLSDDERVFKFPQGMTIQKIIEEIVLISNYGANATKNLDKEGMATWFKIEVECYLLNSPEVEEALGRKPKVYVYNVVPYRVHGGIQAAPNKGVEGAEELAKQVSKKYDYIYSGQNKDVLNFDIQFRTAFFEAIRSDRATAADGDKKGNSTKRNQTDEQVERGADESPGDRVPDYSLESVEGGTYTGGGSEQDAKVNLAKQFHDSLLNSKADLITANLEIWGDPYYLPDSGMGNYSSRNSGVKATLTEDGSIDYQRNEIDILINFRTPVDYRAGGDMSFQSETTKINGFSGFYRVTTVETSITGNKFTQTLELIRRRNQTLDGVGGKSIVEKQNPSSSGNNNGGRPGQTGSPGSTAASSSSGTQPVTANTSNFSEQTPGPPPNSFAAQTPGANPRENNPLAVPQRNLGRAQTLGVPPSSSGAAAIGDAASSAFSAIGDALASGTKPVTKNVEEYRPGGNRRANR